MAKHAAKKRCARAKRARKTAQITAPAADKTPARPRIFARLSAAVRGSALLRGAAALTLFPQHPKVDSSVRAQHEDIAQIWRDVGGYMWTGFNRETARIREHEQQK